MQHARPNVVGMENRAEHSYKCRNRRKRGKMLDQHWGKSRHKLRDRDMIANAVMRRFGHATCKAKRGGHEKSSRAFIQM